MKKQVSGAQALCTTLERLGVQTVFSLPGTQTVSLFEALRHSGLHTVVATHELAASFMANGYYRASGTPGVLLTIPGPGFTYALTGLAEAYLDSAALLYVTVAPATCPGNAFQLQSLDQAALARPITKKIYEVEDAASVCRTTTRAYNKTREGEPGPVLLQIAAGALRDGTTPPTGSCQDKRRRQPAASMFDEAIALIRRSAKPLLLVGQGASDASAGVVSLAERLRAPVVSTTSGRGVVPEDHPLSLGFELGGTEPRALNELADASDLVLALGCKFSHNGSRAFGLRLQRDALIQVDTSKEVLEANYPARLAIQSDVGQFVTTLREQGAQPDEPNGAWPDDELEALRGSSDASWSPDPEPQISGVAPAAFFAALRSVLPRDACVVTDSGLHQMLARRHFRVLAPRGLLVPTNLQSMGFALPAAIGAKLAEPGRTVVAILGDGGALMSGLELLTAVREGLQLCVIVLNDGFYGLIRQSQMANYGSAPGSQLLNPDFALLAEAAGVNYARSGRELQRDFEDALGTPGVTLLEARVGSTWATRAVSAKSRLGRFVPAGVRRALRRARRRL